MALVARSFASSLFQPLSSSPLNGYEGRELASMSLPSSQHKWRMVIAYDGTKFAGWQYQESPPTIQCLIEKALMRITKLDRKQLCLVAAGRTDAGVHAWGQVAHFVTPFTYDSLENLHAALNGLLPSEIRVRQVSSAHPDFHARFSTVSKIYHYTIYNSPVMDPFQSRYAYHCAYKLNPLVMREAASYFVGRHDFTSFANASHCDGSPDPVKQIFRCDVIEMDPVFKIEVEGSGFLYRQVALLIQIGREALPPETVPRLLAARDRRDLAKVTSSALPHGLCLMSVNYCDEILKPLSDFPATSFGRCHSVSKCKLLYF
ncbi:tRNA pseudouridine38-40 synthase [Apostasia shenzhenica]|uniref:tRNA pseudouridine synthase n=1 Tax=Apostasia shenzhenica TaxID=1088818 RepID=A0A2I0B3D1_9ASPA|nr:tRNA pseudouridine38-40 synthase [Apostasia shenzhenica]